MESSEMSDLEHLNEGLAGEHFGIAAYEAALGTGLLDEQTAAVARSFQSDHQFHRAALTHEMASRSGHCPRMTTQRNSRR
jgi:hypothetical protein